MLHFPWPIISLQIRLWYNARRRRKAIMASRECAVVGFIGGAPTRNETGPMWAYLRSPLPNPANHGGSDFFLTSSFCVFEHLFKNVVSAYTSGPNQICRVVLPSISGKLEVIGS
jgi:hypothetical protein